MIVLSNVAAPTEGIRLTLPDVKAYAENCYGGEGTLTVSESSVVWISKETNQGFCLMYPSIILHAVSRDTTAFPEECIYILVDASKSDLKLVPEANEAQASGSVDGSVDEDEEEEGAQVAMRLVPQDKALLPEIYKQLSECQALNPDEEADFSEEDGELYDNGGTNQFFGPGGEAVETLGNRQWYTSETQEDVQLSPEGLANMQRIISNGSEQQESVDNQAAEDEQMEQD